MMVMVLLAQEAVTPAGKPVGVPMPVTLLVGWVTVGIAVLIFTVGELEAAPTDIMVMVAFALKAGHPPEAAML
jgi:hypothetical protein